MSEESRKKQAEYKRQWARANKERITERVKQRYHEKRAMMTKEELEEYRKVRREYAAANKEYFRQKNKEYRLRRKKKSGEQNNGVDLGGRQRQAEYEWNRIIADRAKEKAEKERIAKSAVAGTASDVQSVLQRYGVEYG